MKKSVGKEPSKVKFSFFVSIFLTFEGLKTIWRKKVQKSFQTYFGAIQSGGECKKPHSDILKTVGGDRFPVKWKRPKKNETKNSELRVEMS